MSTVDLVSTCLHPWDYNNYTPLDNAHTVEELNQPAGQAVPQQLPAGNPPGAAGIVWFQWGLLLKLIVTCLLFTYNHRRPMDYYRQANIICVAFLCYLIQIGAIYYWFKMICDILLVSFSSEFSSRPAEPISPYSLTLHECIDIGSQLEHIRPWTPTRPTSGRA